MASDQARKTGSPEPVEDIGSLHAQAQDSREAPRVSLLIKAAKLVVNGQDCLCVLRNVSELGLKITTFQPVSEADILQIETEDGEQYDCELIWAENGQAGLRFKEPINVAHFLGEAEKSFLKRPIRLTAVRPIEIRSDEGTFSGELVNISQSGAQVECQRHFSVDERVRLIIGKLPLIAARVRWRRRPVYGLSFENQFRLDELGRFLSEEE